MKIQRRELPDNHPWRKLPADSPMQLHGVFDVRDKGRDFSVFLTRDDLGASIPDWRWHLSIAGLDMKVPPWDTLVAVAHDIRPGVAFVVGVPPKSWWINVHPGTLHLHEVKDLNLIANWRAQRRADTPT